MALGLAFGFSVTGLSACAGQTQGGNSSSEQSVTEPKLTAVTPANGKNVVLANDEIAVFTEGYAWNYSGEFSVQGQDHFSMKPLTLKWDGCDEGDTYEVVLATKEDLSDGVKYTADSNSLTVKDLFVSTQYYWQVTCTTAGKEGDKSAVNSFKTVTTPRTVDIRGVSNTRDLGGYPTESGKYVRQGMAYRGATLDSIGAEGIEDALVKYGIKTELDVRNASESQGRTESSFGEGAKYYSYSCPYYLGTHGLDINKSQYPEEIENLAKAIKLFAVEDNYPIYYHCSLGRDRTGMVAMLLQGLLGVPREYIYMDYEVSFFSERGCYDFAGNNPKLKVGHMIDSLTGVYNYLDGYGETDGTLPFSENCAKYLQDIGVTETEIASIRSLLLTE